jgi:hypothetical protein
MSVLSPGIPPLFLPESSGNVGFGFSVFGLGKNILRFAEFDKFTH